MERRIYALLVEYDGGPYRGWQPQAGMATVGGVLAAALRRAGVGATPCGASRTDAGVHARAQVASFSSRDGHDPAALARALNDLLPSTIRVRAARVAPKSFHAQWSAVGKIYLYRLSFAGEPRAWRLPSERFPFTGLDPERLAWALGLERAAADLSAMCAPTGRDRPRLLTEARAIAVSSRGATLEFAGPAFGKHMVRHLVAAAVGFAAGAWDEGVLERMLSGTRSRPPPADPDGLSLHRVLYPPGVDPFPDLESLAPP